jgi:uncharacterized protein YabE (DUF348 family)
MKLRTHTISVSKLSYVWIFAVVGLLFGFLITANFSRMHDSKVYAEEYTDNEDAENITDNRFVTFHENGESLTIKTDAKTVGEAISRAKISLAEYDITDPARDEKINSDNYHINIYRARPVRISDGVIKKYIMSASYDKEQVAKAAGFTVYDGDKILTRTKAQNLLETGLVDVYEIKRNGGSTITVEENISYDEKTVQDNNLAAGQQVVKQLGELGKKVTTYKVQFKDGKEVTRIKISEEVTKQPVSRITAVGTKISEIVPNPDKATCQAWMRAAGISENDLEVAYTLIWHESKCRYNATNRSSGAYGIPQSLPGNKMASEGSDWQTNPITQIRWMIKYVKNRYGSWQEAWHFWGCRGQCRNIKNKTSNWY